MTDDAVANLRAARLANIAIFAELARIADRGFTPRDPAAPDVTLEIMVGAMRRDPEAARALIRQVIENDRRVIAAAEAWLGRGALTLRRLDLARDEADTFRWACDVTERAMSFSPTPPTLDEHRAWLRSPIQLDLWIVEEGGAPVGLVRVDADDEVHVTIQADARGRGVGRRAIALACAATNEPLLVARIKAENAASRRAFEAAGFVLLKTGVHRDCPMCYYRWLRPRSPICDEVIRDAQGNEIARAR